MPFAMSVSLLARTESVDAEETSAAFALRAAVNVIGADGMASYQLGEARPKNLSPSVET